MALVGGSPGSRPAPFSAAASLPVIARTLPFRPFIASFGTSFLRFTPSLPRRRPLASGAPAPAPVMDALAVTALGETLISIAPSRWLGRPVVGRPRVGPGIGPWACANGSASRPSLGLGTGGPACPAIRPIWLPAGFPRPPTQPSSALTLARPSPAACTPLPPPLPPNSPPASMPHEWNDAGTRPKRRADDRRPDSSHAEERRDSSRLSPDAIHHEIELLRQLSSRDDRRSPAHDDHRSPSHRSSPRADRRGRSRSRSPPGRGPARCSSQVAFPTTPMGFQPLLCLWR